MIVGSTYKRFIVFEFGWYYPGGGMFDAKTSFDTQDEAMDHYNEVRFEGDCPSYSIHLFDCETRKVVAEKSSKS